MSKHKVEVHNIAIEINKDICTHCGNLVDRVYVHPDDSFSEHQLCLECWWDAYAAVADTVLECNYSTVKAYKEEKYANVDGL